MKNKKRFLAAILAITLCFSVTACNNSKKADSKNETEVKTENPEQDTKAKNNNILPIAATNNKSVTIGDTKDSVKKSMGAPVNERAYALEYDGMTVFVNEKVNMLTVNKKGYTAYKNATIGMKIDDYLKVLNNNEYTIEEQADIGYYRITIIADEKGTIIKTSDMETIAKYTFTITSNNYGEESTITHIQIKEMGV